MFYLVVFNNRKTFDFLKDIVTIIRCPDGKCPITHFKPEDWVLSMIPTSKKYKLPPGGHKLNSNQAIELSKDKPLSRKRLIERGIKVPKTWFSIDAAEIPYIARPKYHKQGKEFYVIRTQEQHEEFKNSNIHDTTWYYSELLDVTKEVRIIFLGNILVYAYEFPVFSTPEETVGRRNEVMGTSEDPGFHAYTELTDDEIELSRKALNYLGLEYGSADLLFTPNGAYITEINYFPNPRSYIKPHLREAIIKFKKIKSIE